MIKLRSKRIESSLFRLIVLPPGQTRSLWERKPLILITPRSIDKRAVLRNRLRRRAREWGYRHPEFFKKGRSAAIFFKKEAIRAPRNKFYEELKKAFSGVR